MTLEVFRAEFCLPFQKFYDRYTPHLPLAQLEEWFHFRFREVQDSVVELPHARAFLEYCRQRQLRTFVLSSILADYFHAQAQAMGFDRLLDKPYVRVYDKREKIGEILKENGLAPQETLFIGDMEHDIETAKHGGVWSCAVLTGYNTRAQLQQANPDVIVAHLAELRQILENGQAPFQAAAQSPQTPKPNVRIT